VHLLEVGYNDYIYDYNKCWNGPHGPEITLQKSRAPHKAYV